jgi:hypothetical protein
VHLQPSPPVSSCKAHYSDSRSSTSANAASPTQPLHPNDHIHLLIRAISSAFVTHLSRIDLSSLLQSAGQTERDLRDMTGPVNWFVYLYPFPSVLTDERMRVVTTPTPSLNGMNEAPATRCKNVHEQCTLLQPVLKISIYTYRQPGRQPLLIHSTSSP